MSWETKHEKLYKDGVLIQHRIQRTPDGEWEDYVPEEPPPAKKAHMKAFPNVTSEKGMDLRDYFAAKAMPSVIKKFKKGHPDGWYGIAMVSYMAADAMMKEREEK